MALMDEPAGRGKIYSGGGDLGTGLDAPVIEPATGQETGIATPRPAASGAPAPGPGPAGPLTWRRSRIPAGPPSVAAKQAYPF
jgi:hypothetical protein